MDYLVIGAGPAGLQLGWLFHQSDRDYLVLEAGAAPGTSYHRFRHRRRMSAAVGPVPEAWSRLRTEVRPPLDPAGYVRYLTEFAVAHELKIRYRSRVTRVARDDRAPRFVVTDQSGRVYLPKRVIVATGLGRPYLPPVPGIEAAERHDETEVDPAEFAGRRVLVVGKGETAFATAAALGERAAMVHVVGPRSVPFARIAELTDATGRRWAGNEIFNEPRRHGVQHAVLDATVRRIERLGAADFMVTLSHVRQAGAERMRTVQLRYDGVIACTGFQLDTTIFDPSCRPDPALNGRLPALTSEWESVNVPDLYFTGALTQVGGARAGGGAFAEGMRYCARALRRMLDRKYEGIEWPSRDFPADAATLAAAVLRRVNRGPGLFQRYAMLCDLIVVAPYGTVARYYEEMPVDYVHDSLFGSADRYFTINLEYGDASAGPDPVAEVPGGRTGPAADAADRPGDRYPHPVIRHYHRWSLVAVQRLPEDMDNDWASEEEYRGPLRSFFAQQMALALA
jgi:thioredoxin reductase